MDSTWSNNASVTYDQIKVSFDSLAETQQLLWDNLEQQKRRKMVSDRGIEGEMVEGVLHLSNLYLDALKTLAIGRFQVFSSPRPTEISIFTGVPVALDETLPRPYTHADLEIEFPQFTNKGAQDV